MADTNAEDFIEKIEKKSDALFKAQRIIKNWTTEKWIDTKDGIPDIEFDKHTVKYIVETLAKDEKIDKQLIATIMPRLEKLNQVGSVKGADFVKQELKKIAGNIKDMVSACKYDAKTTEKMFNIAKTIQADNYMTEMLSPKALEVYENIAFHSIPQPKIYNQILQEIITHSVQDLPDRWSNYSDLDNVRDMLRQIANSTNGDEQCADNIIKCVQRFARNEYHTDYNTAWETIIADLAVSSISNPKVVEKCLVEADKYHEIYQHLKVNDYSNFYKDIGSLIYEKVAVAGYEANDFLNRYTQKLNDGSMLSYSYQPQLIEKMAEKLNVDVLRWEAAATNEDSEDRDVLKKLADTRILEMAIAEAKSNKNPPAIIFVEEYVGDRYGDWAERVYVKDSNGDYIPTNTIDNLHWDNGLSAREQIEDAGRLLAVAHGVYQRDDDISDFNLLESNEKYNYRVVSNEAYWRDPITNSMQLATRGAHEGSTLVTKNPVTGKFEDVEFKVNYCNGDYLQEIKQEKDGPDKTIIYKRNAKDGHFYADAEFPATELMHMEQRDNNVIAMSFMAENGDYYNYMSDNRHSALAKKRRDADKFEYVDPFTNKPHTQKPLKNIINKKTKSSGR